MYFHAPSSSNISLTISWVTLIWRDVTTEKLIVLIKRGPKKSLWSFTHWDQGTSYRHLTWVLPKFDLSFFPCSWNNCAFFALLPCLPVPPCLQETQVWSQISCGTTNAARGAGNERNCRQPDSLCVPSTEITLAVREDESTSQSANSLHSVRGNLPQWCLRFAVPALQNHITGWPNNSLWSIHSLPAPPACSHFLIPDVPEPGGEQQVKPQDREGCSWSGGPFAHGGLLEAGGMIHTCLPLSSSRNSVSHARRQQITKHVSEAAGGPVGAGGAAAAWLSLPAPWCLLLVACSSLPAATATAGPSRHQQGSAAEVVGRQLQGVITQAVWRGGNLGKTGSGCQESSESRGGIAAWSRGTSRLGQWDLQGGWGKHWGERGSLPNENFGLWFIGPGNLGTPVISI